MVYISKGSHTLFTNTIGGLHMTTIELSEEERKRMEEKKSFEALVKSSNFYNAVWCLSNTVSPDQFTAKLQTMQFGDNFLS